MRFVRAGAVLTGANIAVVAGAGGLLLTGGLAAFVLARRRRTSFSA
ncbi:LPXTG cell wall anchor domain-containing protein [Paractinoplanes hotanensis]|uniref:LPXTG cell wall anchor domain-containing protein n=1 Tax=Paractinoplanes hotanensis TaxID=2906497 RepID=A0ABT0YDT5_9ACTN|nr:LPXTG cell wall anchor domain-containing protein [Actinoplanes hotanensis]MCM4083955.1 LPXTG cell wall anchor domain-containing protein [Actinoplanes hotanensis]